MEVKPYNTGKSKREEVEEMFDSISPKYDFLNHFLSLGIDVSWRKKAVKILGENNPKFILDVATGTADFALQTKVLNPDSIIGVDISEGMLSVGRQKIKERNLEQLIQLKKADSEQLPFSDNQFDGISVAFGVRNFQNLCTGLKEMHRVLKPGGKVVILEFSKPKHFPIKQVFGFYFRYILPALGRMLSKDKSAYTYLPESVDAFPCGRDFTKVLGECGYKTISYKTLSFGIATIYVAHKN